MRLIKLNDENIVIQVRYNAKTIKANEIESKNGEIGQKFTDDGTFSDVETEEEIILDMYQQLLIENQYQTFLLESLLMGGDE